VAKHLARFTEGPLGPDEQGMVNRLNKILDGGVAPTDYDQRFYTHELREWERYCEAGWPEGQPSDEREANELWNSLHTASLEDFGLNEKRNPLYHPDYQ
jgi:hypothetical protein